ncbi:hypothetical protein [Aureivirga sp. CE67]|uniref:hypothetical protein n=1 Tax=Aureivirga sp. CE67 TaxID=1788983 RepID=UPI0018C8FDB7|nr:hypothetical protein [Aureivirga sp. CE67]
MKKYKEDIFTIIQLVTFILAWFAFAQIDNPIFAIFSGVFWIFLWSRNIYYKIQYRKNKLPDVIRIPTQNDNYYKTTSLSFGVMLIVGMSFWIYYANELIFIPIFGLVSGILIFINGIIDIPKGEIKIENSELKIHGIKDKILINSINSIQIENDRLVINKGENSIVKLDKLELDKDWNTKIIAFLNKNLNTEEIDILEKQ